MASFGAISCDIVRGQSNMSATELQLFTRPGVAGHGAIDLGQRSAQNRYTLVRHGSYATCLAWTQAIQLLRGSIVAVVDDWGTTTAAWLYTEYDTPTIRRADPGSGTAAAVASLTVRGMAQ